MTQNMNDINGMIRYIAGHGARATRDISALHALAPKARALINALVDEAENNIVLLAEVDRLNANLCGLRHRATAQELVTDGFVGRLISSAIAYGDTLYGDTPINSRDTSDLDAALDAAFTKLEAVDLGDLFDAAIRSGLARARRQRSARAIVAIAAAIRSVVG